MISSEYGCGGGHLKILSANGYTNGGKGDDSSTSGGGGGYSEQGYS